MTSPASAASASIRPPETPPRTAVGVVVAGLVNDGSAPRVASAGLDYALAHGMALSFVHVVPDGAQRQSAEDAEDTEDTEDTTFAAVLKALRGHGRVHCAFEVVHGDPERVLVERSRAAALLVVGSDTSSPGASIAEYCRLHAGCTVLTVDATGTDRRTHANLT